MHTTRIFMLAILVVTASGLVGCKSKSTTGATTTPKAGASSSAESSGRCTRDNAFPENIDLPEASAAAEVELTPGIREILVVADGHRGKVFAWRVPSGPGRTFHLDLDANASEDIEGMAWLEGKVYTLTSSGAVRVFTPDGSGGLRREGPATRIGAPPFSCERLEEKQCGYNFEGLCLRPKKANQRCAGYAASKERSHLLCVRVEDNGALAIDPKEAPIAFGIHKHALSDCAFGARGGPAEGKLFVTTNSKGGSETYAVDEAASQGASALKKINVEGTASNEALAIDRDGTLYVFADAHQKKSEGRRFLCSW
jgi:hypothetical protein